MRDRDNDIEIDIDSDSDIDKGSWKNWSTSPLLSRLVSPSLWDNYRLSGTTIVSLGYP